MKRLLAKQGGCLVCFTFIASLAMAQPYPPPTTHAHYAASVQGGQPVASCPQNAPVNLLVCVSSRLLKTLKREKQTISQNPSALYHIVRQELLPYVDKQRLTQVVMGRRAWNQATPDQRDRLTDALIKRVVSSYSQAFDAYTDEGIRFYPLKGETAHQQFVTVQSQIVRNQGPPVAVHYSLTNTDGRWQVYDVIVEGVSMTQSFGSQIQSMLSQGRSIDEVIARLQQPVPSTTQRRY